MKKLLFMMAVAASATLAQADRVVISYLSLGPDTYAGGKSVLEGEFYALVFVKAGQTFAGFNADGTLVDPANGEILEMGPWAANWAKSGVGCKPHNIQPEESEAAKYVDGTIRLFVLDTRDASGKLSGATKTETGYLPKAINGYGEVTSAKYSFAGGSSLVDMTKKGAATLASAVPAGAPTPKITGMRIQDGYAYLTVENTVPYLQYNVASGAKPEVMDNQKAAEAPKGGDVSAPIELKVPLNQGGQFFKVNRNGLDAK